MPRKRTITWHLFRFFPTSFYKTNYILETGRERNNIILYIYIYISIIIAYLFFLYFIIYINILHS